MSDTPRTDAWKWSGGDDPMGEFYKFACQLERELNAANERIKRLEEESESRWHLAQSAIGSCAEMSSRIKGLLEALEVLLSASKKVQMKGYNFAQLDRGVVMARDALAKAKEAKP